MTTLPPPRRIIAAHGINGEPHIIDEEIHYPADSPFQAAVGFLQPELVGKPDKAIEWASIKPARLSNDDAISLRWLGESTPCRLWQSALELIYVQTFPPVSKSIFISLKLSVSMI